MNRTVTVTLIAAMAAVVTGCATTVSKSPPPTHSPGSPSPLAPSQVGQIGDKFTVTSGETKYDVTLLGVHQQAQPESEFLGAEPGHHLAAAQFRVTAITSTDENSNTNASVTGSNEQAYNSALKPVTAGTNFASGRVLLQPGSSLIGWVSFELPTGVMVAKVHWTPSAGFSTRSAEWLVKSSPAPSPEATPTASPEQTSNPADTVKAYFDAINLRDYQKAWNLGGKNTGESYTSFVGGFKTTAMVAVQILDISGDIGTGVVTARVTSLETDGSTKVFEGTYTVRNGVIERFNVRPVR